MTDNKIYLQHLLLSQTSSKTEDIHIKSDILISFISWEERCLEITNSNIYAKENVVFRFGENEEENRNVHEKLINGWLEKAPGPVNKYVGASSTDCLANFNNLTKLLSAAFMEYGRQIDLTIDISCCPKSLITFIIGFGLSKGLFRKLNFFYSHTNYDEKVVNELNINGATSYRFTEGDWNSIQIPFLEGNYRASAPRELVVSMGAEAVITESFIRRYQPDILNFLLPLPGVTKELDASISREISTLANKLELSDKSKINAHAYDMIESVNAYKFFVDRSQGTDLSIACLGTKPHAIGAAIVAFTSNYATLICRSPLSYRQTPSKPNGIASLYTIEDLSAL